MVKLYKFINGVWEFCDYGVPNLVSLYCLQGFIVIHI